MLKEEHLKLLVCPTCKAGLKRIRAPKKVFGFFCEICQVIYPVKDGIPIILAEEARNYDLEYPLIKRIEEKLPINSSYGLHKLIEKTLDLLESKKTLSTWEWEDEEFWSRKYAKEMVARVPVNSNQRMWQREFLVEELTNRMSLKSKTILDVGSGAGENFRFLLSKYCDESSFYIAADISFKGLELNRARNTHKNSLYVLCSADYELPFISNTVDALCYFGILHHTKKKNNNIQKDKRLVKKNGYIIVVEAVDRPALPLASRLMSNIEKSVHEEHISKKALLAELARREVFELVFIREEGTPFSTGMMRFFPNIMINHKRLFLFILNLDILVSKTVGHIIPFLGAGEIQLLARITRE